MLNDALMPTVHDLPEGCPTFHGMDGATANRLAFALIDRIGSGIAAISADGQLFHANRSAREELARGPTLQVDGERVRCLRAYDAEWRAALHDAAVRQRSRLLWLGSDDARLRVIAMPMHVEGLATPAALVMFGRRSVCSPLGIEMLASRHGLTYAERRVFSALVENRSTSEIAAIHGVGMSTIRSQIMSIREKLQVRSIDALLLRAAEVPPVTALH
jgi:DNA-binding CsgD family transcriptional regulator